LPTYTLISTPIFGIGSTITGSDGMTLVYVPEGEFKMGTSDTISWKWNDQKPQHTVYLDAFWIDQNEVTNKQYAVCVSDGSCALPSDTKSYMYSESSDHPVIYISWNDATAYCSWANRRLPTEAEWEKAARGPNGYTYPWGNDAPTFTLLNYLQHIGSTTKVGSYPSGKSYYGVYDMAGNVSEWVNDWYSGTYYGSSPSSNPLGPETGQYRVLRGGSWTSDGVYVRSTYRSGNDPLNTSIVDGFRCARNVTQ
jgi:formylglycine-generating enzyme required for sulfatase activity